MEQGPRQSRLQELAVSSLLRWAFAGDKLTAVKLALSFYKPTGPLSGVSTLGILAWLVTWALLEWRWRSVNVSLGSVCAFALVLLGLAFLLTFPPVVDFL
jgi:hypothetical protein